MSGAVGSPAAGANLTLRRIFVLAIGAFALGLNTFVTAGLLPLLAADLDVSLSLAGQLVTAFTLFYAVSAPLFAALVPNLPLRTVLAAALAIFTLGNALSAVADSFATLTVARAVAGIGAGLYAPLAASGVAALVPPEQRGRGLSFVIGGMSAGTVLGVPLGLLLAAHAGWRMTFLLIAALAAVALVGIVLRIPSIRTGAALPLRERLSVLGERDVALTLIVSFLFATASLGLYTYIAPLLNLAGGGDLAFAVLVWGFGGIVGSFTIGPLIDRTGRPGDLVTLIIGLLCLAELALAALPASHPGVFVLLFVWGFAGWASPVPQQHRLLEGRPHHGSLAVALNASAIYLGGAAGAAIGGGALAGGVTAQGLPLVFAMIAIAALALHLAQMAWTRRAAAERRTRANQK